MGKKPFWRERLHFRPTKSEKRDRFLFRLSLAVLLAVLVFFLIAPHFLPHDPHGTDLSAAMLPAGSPGYLLGTDHLGRCMFCRIIEGGRQTAYSSLLVVFIVFLFGSALGMIAGYCGGAADAVISRITTVFQAFPSFVLAIAIAGILGPGRGNGMIAMILVYWTTYTRYGRSLVLTLKNETYVRAARMCRANPAAILIRYILPNMIPPLLLTAALDIGNVVLAMAGLSFIGLGSARPTAEWGAMMSESRRYLQVRPSLILLPGIALLIVVFLFNFCSDCGRNVLDRKGHQA